jgi:hypothetical protein
VLPICLLPSTPEEYMFEAQESKYIQLPRALQYLTPATKIFSNQTCTYIFLYDVSHFLLFNNIEHLIIPLVWIVLIVENIYLIFRWDVAGHLNYCI